jgi:formyl-CoA transferase/CoA:oxalate CoA-transferase
MIAPLDGLTVLDLSRVLSGPFATQQLIDLGAEVIKIEQPGSGDDTRGFGPPFLHDESTYFMSVNRGKKSVAIDLKHPAGKALILDLAARADVVIENFKPGTADRLGIGMLELRRRNPRLVTCSISGYGADGDPAFAGRAGYDAIIQAASGLMSLTGAVDGPPSRVGVAIADLVAGLFAAQGILAALAARGLRGEGTHVDVSMQEAMATILTYQAGIFFATGKPPPRMGDAHPSICPYESLRTQDGLYMVAVGNDAQFVRFAAMIGLPQLAQDPRFATNRARVEHRPELLAEIGPRLAAHSSETWDRRFAEAGIPGGPVLDVQQALEHPQITARRAILEHDHPRAGTVRSVASPVRMAGAPREGIAPAPVLGQHTREILAARLGLSAERIAELERERVVAAADG